MIIIQSPNQPLRILFWMLEKQYWVELKEYIVDSPNSYKFQCLIFIFIANFFGTNPFLEFGDSNYSRLFLEIWTWSLLGNIVYVLTMTICFYIPIRMAMESKSFMGYFFSPLLTPFLVTLGYAISWFFVCFSTDPNILFSDSDWTKIEFITPISFQMDLGAMAMLLFGYNGLWTTLVYVYLVITANVFLEIKR